MLRLFFITLAPRHTKSEAKVITVSVGGQDKGYTVKYDPPPEGVPEGEARGNCWMQHIILKKYYANDSLIKLIDN